MQHIAAIGFDMVNTLITLNYNILSSALKALMNSLEQSGFDIQESVFKETYKAEAVKCFRKAHQDHIEIHNSVWICNTLQTLGCDVRSDDSRILEAVDAYFSEFFTAAALIPGTEEILTKLHQRYALAILSNFTHAPFIRELIKRRNIAHFFDVVLVSGELGYRKPHPNVFKTLVDELGKKASEIMYIGDDPDADIQGAEKAGLYPVWTTIVQDQNLTSIAANPFFETTAPGNDVPRISKWNDLLSLLDAMNM